MQPAPRRGFKVASRQDDGPLLAGNGAHGLGIARRPVIDRRDRDRHQRFANTELAVTDAETQRIRAVVIRIRPVGDAARRRLEIGETAMLRQLDQFKGQRIGVRIRCAELDGKASIFGKRDRCRRCHRRAVHRTIDDEVADEIATGGAVIVPVETVAAVS